MWSIDSYYFIEADESHFTAEYFRIPNSIKALRIRAKHKTPLYPVEKANKIHFPDGHTGHSVLYLEQKNYKIKGLNITIDLEMNVDFIVGGFVRAHQNSECFMRYQDEDFESYLVYNNGVVIVKEKESKSSVRLRGFEDLRVLLKGINNEMQ